MKNNWTSISGKMYLMSKWTSEYWNWVIMNVILEHTISQKQMKQQKLIMSFNKRCCILSQKEYKICMIVLGVWSSCNYGNGLHVIIESNGTCTRKNHFTEIKYNFQLEFYWGLDPVIIRHRLMTEWTW